MSKRPLIALIALVVLAVGSYLALGGGPEPQEPEAQEQAKGPRAKHSGPTSGTDDEPTRVEVRGSVKDAKSGAGLEGALVLFTDASADEETLPRTVRTDGNGQFQLALDPGTYSVSASARGYQPRAIPRVTVGAGAGTSVELTLISGGNPLTGTVSDAGGGPIGGALVRLVPQSGFARNLEDQAFATLTDEEGQYDLRVADGRYTARVSHADYVPTTRLFELRGGDRTQDFSMVPAASIEGRVVRAEDGEPLANARVLYHREVSMQLPYGGSRSVTGRGKGTVRTDDQGRFRISGLEGGLILLRAAARGHASAELTSVPIAVAEHVDGIELRVEAARSIAGKVSQASDGAPLAGVRVSARVPGGQPGPQLGATTGEDGTFRIDGLITGEYGLSASADGFLPNLRGSSVTVGDEDIEGVEISLDAGVAITGRIEPPQTADVRIELNPDEAGKLAANVSVLAAGGGATSADKEGQFTLRPLKPGHYELAARTSAGERGTLSVDVPEGGLEDVVLRLEEAAGVSGRVIDSHGEPVARATVALSPHQPGRSVQMIVNGRNMVGDASPTASDGSFRMSGLAPGTYAIEITDEFREPLTFGDGKGPMTVTVNEGQKKELDLLVEATDGVIRGQVVDADGAPAPDSWVTVSAQPELAAPPKDLEPGEGHTEMRSVIAISDDSGAGFARRPPVLTDTEGRFEVAGLRDGKYEVVVEGMRGGARTTERDVMPGADITIRLAPLGGIEGKVSVGQRPVKDFLVQLSGRVGSNRRFHDEDGNFALKRLDPGKYSLTVTSDRGTATTSVVVEPGQTAKAKLDLTPWSKVSGLALGTDGQPLVGHRVALGEAAGGGGFTLSIEDDDPTFETDEAGRFEVQAAAGPHVLMVLGKDTPMPLVVHPFTVEPGVDKDLGTVNAVDLAAMGAKMAVGDEGPPPGHGEPSGAG